MKDPGFFAHKWIGELKQFWRSELWQLDPGTLPPASAFLLRLSRILDLVGRGIRKNDLRVHASGLTYMTLMSIIPFIAIAIWIFKALGLHLDFIEESKTYFADFPPHFQTFFDQTLRLVEQTNFAQLGIVGATVLVLTAFGLLGKMEAAINKIWDIRHTRTLFRRWINYLSFIVLVPIMVFVVIRFSQPVAPLERLLGSLGTFLGLVLCFGFLYSKLPNTQVRLLASVSGAVITAILWKLWFLIFITIQPGVTNYNIIYGTLSFLPIFLAWLYVGWVLILLGAEIAYAIQHEKSFQLHREGGRISMATQMSVALAIMIRASRAFDSKEAPMEANDFSHEHQIPYRFLQQTLNRLVAGELLIRSQDHESLYVLRKNPSQIQAKQIVDLFLHNGRSTMDLELSAYRANLLPLAQALGSSLEQSLGALSLETIAKAESP